MVLIDHTRLVWIAAAIGPDLRFAGVAFSRLTGYLQGGFVDVDIRTVFDLTDQQLNKRSAAPMAQLDMVALWADSSPWRAIIFCWR
jgi:hypothetical protein